MINTDAHESEPGMFGENSTLVLLLLIGFSQGNCHKAHIHKLTGFINLYVVLFTIRKTIKVLCAILAFVNHRNKFETSFEIKKSSLISKSRI